MRRAWLPVVQILDANLELIFLQRGGEY
jgi:hypothetical protein